MTRALPRPATIRARDVLALGRPEFWAVSWVPYYLGFLLASRRLVPAPAQAPELLAGAVVIGPLMWLVVLAVNDVHDLPGDRLNPRKVGAPLTSGRVTPATARRIAGCAAVLAVTVSWMVGTAFACAMAVALLLGWAYSAPPIRLKTRPGADLAVNATALGAFGPLAGWVVERPVTEFPWAVAALGTLVAAALYVPTTLADLAADRAGGYTTIAVRLGERRTYLVGLSAWVTAAALSVVLAAADHVIPRRMLTLEMVMVPVLIAAYRHLAIVERSFRGVILLAVAFLAPCVTFALAYTGIW